MDKWLNQIIKGDCLEVMKELPDKSVDSIVTDPPYELGFMGKSWDNTGIAYNVELWRECLRVLKPGGHLLSFGGSRTYHRMACAIEDAGFEIRDCIQWIYATGFPKSMDISKAIDKKFGAEREVVGSYTTRDLSRKDGKHKGDMLVGCYDGSTEFNITAPSTPEAIQWNGWGTALKPANEPIVVARKPLSEKTVAENVLKWGTGGINIDGCRIESNDLKIQKQRVYKSGTGGFMTTAREDASSERNGKLDMPSPYGRFPANIILDEESGEMLDEQSGILKSGDNCIRTKVGSFLEHGGLGKAGDVQRTYGDSGGASRFFYCAKASKKERGEDNNHPTVKPIALMKYLARLITPPEGIMLDPFAGSGTTLIASKLEGFFFIGIEREAKYCEIARRRVKEAEMQQSLFA